MPSSLDRFRRSARRDRVLTPEQLAQKQALVRRYLERAERAGRPVTPQSRAGMHAAATCIVLHGPPPTRSQRLGYRTAKRRREWAEQTRRPGSTYPGRRGVRSEFCRGRNHAGCPGLECACKCHRNG